MICGVPGQCIDVALGGTKASSVDACVIFCNADPNCNFWTFNQDSDLCMTFPGCKEVDEVACPSCVYGERECPMTGRVLCISL